MENRAVGALVAALLLCCMYSAPVISESLRVLLDGFIENGFDPARVEAPATLIGRACTWATQPVRCELGSVRSAGTHSETFSFIARGTGPLQIALRVGGRNDFNAANDQLAVTVNVTNPADR